MARFYRQLARRVDRGVVRHTHPMRKSYSGDIAAANLAAAPERARGNSCGLSGIADGEAHFCRRCCRSRLHLAAP